MDEAPITIRKYTLFDEMKADKYRYWQSRPKGIVVQGAAVSESLLSALEERGISITEHTQDGFVGMLANDAPVPGLWALTKFLENGG